MFCNPYFKPVLHKFEKQSVVLFSQFLYSLYQVCITYKFAKEVKQAVINQSSVFLENRRRFTIDIPNKTAEGSEFRGAINKKLLRWEGKM